MTDAANNTTTYAFDASGRLTSQTDPLGKTTTSVYDAAGRLTALTDRMGREKLFLYDALGRMTSQIWENSGGTPVETLTYSFDANGNMLSAGNSNGTYTVTYDNLNRPSTAQDMWSNTLTFGYDALGNRTTVQDSHGGLATSVYDAINNLTQRKFSDGSSNVRVDHLYDGNGRVTATSRYSDLAGTGKVADSTYGYDDGGRLTRIQHTDSSSSNIANYTQTYDAGNRLTNVERNTVIGTYTYDNGNQLTNDGTNAYSYDGTGNRTMTGYSTGTGNRLSADGTWNYSYDDEGNTTKKSQGASAETWTYGYDNANELIWAEKRSTDGGTLQMRVDYEYDVFGNRIEKAVDSDGDSSVDTTERYAYDGWQPGSGFTGNENWDIWADLDGSSSLTTRYVSGDAVDQLFARIGSGSTYWLLEDHLGSVRDIIDNTGTVKDSIAYDGYGNITSETNSAYRGRYTFNSREYDVETGFLYYRARYYSTDTGRWVTQDPLGFDAGDSNVYRYVMNKPTMARDPSGMDHQLTNAERLFKTNWLTWNWIPRYYSNSTLNGGPEGGYYEIRVSSSSKVVGFASSGNLDEQIHLIYQQTSKDFGFPGRILLLYPPPTNGTEARKVIAEHLTNQYRDKLRNAITSITPGNLQNSTKWELRNAREENLIFEAYWRLGFADLYQAPEKSALEFWLSPHGGLVWEILNGVGGSIANAIETKNSLPKAPPIIESLSTIPQSSSPQPVVHIGRLGNQKNSRYVVFNSSGDLLLPYQKVGGGSYAQVGNRGETVVIGSNTITPQNNCRVYIVVGQSEIINRENPVTRTRERISQLRESDPNGTIVFVARPSGMVITYAPGVELPFEIQKEK